MSTDKESPALRFLYGTAVGRILLRPLTSRTVSKICGAFLDSRLSKPLIKGFIKKNGIDLNDYADRDFACFNGCFTRRILPELRPIDTDENALISPCDARLTVYPVNRDTVMPIKQSAYSVRSLLKNGELAEKYDGGLCLVFRLCVDDYHRYCYIDSGKKTDNVFIPGKLHTVRPIALEKVPVFTENCREYTTIESKVFGSITQIEVGAMLVGRIVNHDGACETLRGKEKGLFLYGGSTVVVLLEKGKAVIDKKYISASENGTETRVLMGQRIGTSAE